MSNAMFTATPVVHGPANKRDCCEFQAIKPEVRNPQWQLRNWQFLHLSLID